MKVRKLEREVWLPRPVGEVFAFFSDAENLDAITPPSLNFKILSPLPIEMKTGARIDYRMRLRGLPITWQTEITVWEPTHRFVDMQIHGPYLLWEHTHKFGECYGGTLMTDVVRYRVPGWILEPIVHLFVRPELERIFNYREQQMKKRFGLATASA